MKIDLTCPIELRNYEIICDDRGYVRAYITFNNLAPHPIERFEAIACWGNSRTGQSSAQPFWAELLEADARREFRFSLSTAAVPEADVLEIHFQRVRYANDAAEWIGGQAELVDVSELPRESGRALRALSEAAGDDAVRFPEMRSSHWICVCGRCNDLQDAVCSRCLRERSDVFAHLTRKRLLEGEPSAAGASGHRHGHPASGAKPRNTRRRQQKLVRRAVTLGLIALILAISGMIGIQRAEADASARLSQAPAQTTQCVAPQRER